jgi:hypothetical protein
MRAVQAMRNFLVGSAIFWALSGGAAMASPLIGHYAGDDAQLDVRADGFSLNLACAHASIAGKLRPDARRRFTATGTYENASAGPQRVDETTTSHTARFAGSLAGNRLTLTITPTTGEPHILHLDRNRHIKLVRCL